jgi:c(7)-type cytochrome triheme protein
MGLPIARGGARTIALALTLAWASAGGAQAPTPPADFALPRADSSPGQVTFSHQRHTAKGLKCTTCHMRDFKMKRGASGPITLAAKQEGKFCGACHDGKPHGGGAPVFPIDDCERCHKD